MRVLVACEESQEVCKAFRELGHEAYSCDIEPCSGGKPEWHLQCDALELLKMRWDMILAFPPCTYLSNAGAKHLFRGGILNQERYKKGLTDRKISEATGATVSAVGNWRQRNKLPPNKVRKPVEIPEEKTGDPCLRCYSREICKKVGGTCNEKERWTG